jgi:hypothetical protein
MSGWAPMRTWEDDGHNHGYRHVRAVWSVAGPGPFGGLRCNGEQHASDVCAELNRLTGRKPEVKARPEPEPCPVADSLRDAMRGRFPDLQIDTRGQAIRFGICEDEIWTPTPEAGLAFASLYESQTADAKRSAADWDALIAAAYESGEALVPLRQVINMVDGDMLVGQFVHTATLIRDGDGVYLRDERWT